MRIVFLDESTINLDNDMDFSPISRLGEFESFPLTTQEQVAHRAAGSDVVVVNKVLMREQELAQLPDLKHIAIIATGVNNVDLESAKARGTAVTNVAGYARYIVPQHTFALILNLAGKVLEYVGDVRRGEWAESSQFTLLKYHTFELQGKTIGIIGFGAIGRGTAKIAEAFGMQVLAYDLYDFDHPQYSNTPLETVLKESDVVSVHAPLTEQTRGLISERELDMMKPSALLINTGRGGIVDEQALMFALENDVIAGAGLDVLSAEPPVGNPITSFTKNLLITPHAAWSAREARQRLIDEVGKNINAVMSGEDRNRVV